MKNEEYKLELVRLPIEDLHELTLLIAREEKDKEMQQKLQFMKVGEFNIHVKRFINEGYIIQGSEIDDTLKLNGRKIHQDVLYNEITELRLQMIEYLLENGSKEMFVGIRELDNVQSLVKEQMKSGKL